MLTLNEARKHLRLDETEEDDAYLNALIAGIQIRIEELISAYRNKKSTKSPSELEKAIASEHPPKRSFVVDDALKISAKLFLDQLYNNRSAVSDVNLSVVPYGAIFFLKPKCEQPVG